jgi:hypothetical protein
MNYTNQLQDNLPKNFAKTINELARTREKSATQKYLLDLGESLVMHLCSFVLGEYKKDGNVNIELEKSFIKNNKNISFGIYLNWLRSGSKHLHKINNPSRIHGLLHGNNEMNELSEFIKIFDTVKHLIDDESDVNYSDVIKKSLSQNYGKVNFLSFFDTFIQLRNRVAHPHKEINGKNIVWPISEAYFDATNPYLEAALYKCLSELNQIWEYRKYIVESNQDGVLFLINEDSGEVNQIAAETDYTDGIKVLANAEKEILLSDWKLLIQAGAKALEEIKKEEEALRNKASIEELKESIKTALNDQQISLEEFNFFESLAKTKLGISKNELKDLIMEVATLLNIPDPFPEVDKRFLAALDDALITKNYNEFILKLTAQQYGIDAEQYEKLLTERAEILELDFDEIKLNRVIQFGSDELQHYVNLIRAWQWLMNLYLFNSLNKESQYEITADSHQFGTKEYWHRTSFKSIEDFVESRLLKLCINENEKWETNQNNWQIGRMTGYAWCAIFPKNAISFKFLALHLSLYPDGSAAIGFLPDWKDWKQIEKYGLMLSIFREHLKEFNNQYKDELKKHSNLLMWDDVNNKKLGTFTEVANHHVWYLDFIFNFNQIQFVQNYHDIEKNPIGLTDAFDISFNLFNGLFEGVNRDYQNLLENSFLLEEKEQIIKNKIADLIQIINRYTKADINIVKSTTISDESEDHFTLDVEVNQAINGSTQLGYYAIDYREKVKGFPILLKFKIEQNYLNNQLYFSIQMSAGEHSEDDTHRALCNIMKQLSEKAVNGYTGHYFNGKLLIYTPVENIEEFEPQAMVIQFMESLTMQCAMHKAEILNLTIKLPDLENIIPKINETLDSLKPELATLFSNQITSERNIMRRCRYIDYVYSGRKVGHYIGWGVDWDGSKLNQLIVMHVMDSIKGAHLVESMKSFAKENSNWQLSENKNQFASDATWLGQKWSDCILSSSSDYNRNYTPKNAYFNNEKHFWCPKIADQKQWLQVQFEQTLEIQSIKIQGASHHKTFVQAFELEYSQDGKNWQSKGIFQALNEGNETKEIELPEAIRAKFLKFKPTAFAGFPAMRLDLKVQEIAASAVELLHLSPLSENKGITAQYIAESIQEIKDLF